MHIQIDEIAKEFGTTTALHPVSLSIPSGALVALLGPSGSGKTTLLRILGGLEFPTSGRVLFNSQFTMGQAQRSGYRCNGQVVYQGFDASAFGNVRRTGAMRKRDMETALEKSRKNTLAALNSRARAVPSTMMMPSASTTASRPPGSGIQPYARQAMTRITICGPTW